MARASERLFRNAVGMTSQIAGQPGQIVIRRGCNTLDETSMSTPTTRRRHRLAAGGRAFELHVHPADIQDRDGAGPPLRASRMSWPFVELACRRQRPPGTARREGKPCPRRDRAQTGRLGRVRGPCRRSVVERLFAWINRNRRLAKDVAATLASAEAFLYAASSCCCYADWLVEQPIRNRLSEGWLGPKTN